MWIAIPQTTANSLSWDSESGKNVYKLKSSGVGSEIIIDSSSGENLNGSDVPTLMLTSMPDDPHLGHEYRYIFASLGKSFAFLKDINNHYGIRVERLGRNGPKYLVTWDGALAPLLRRVLHTPYYDVAAPQVVLRLEGRKLLNASSCFSAEYDEQIAATAKDLTETHIATFLKAPEAERNLDIRIAVLRRILNYVYSGREPQAWQTLDRMWPPVDGERLKNSILTAYRTGILSQTDGSDRCNITEPAR